MLIPVKIPTFGNGYHYQDLVASCATSALAGTASLNTGIDEMIHSDYCQIEFETDLTGQEILDLYNVSEEKLRRDVAYYYVRMCRKARREGVGH